MIFFVQYLAKPEKAGHAKGAYINCWIKAESDVSAELLSKNYVSGCGWKIIKTNQLHISDESLYQSENEGLLFHRQAEEEECVIVCYTWTQADKKAKERKRKLSGNKKREEQSL